jgi:FkbM family methyltransferase
MRLRGAIKKWLYGSCPGFVGSFPYFGTSVYFPKESWLFSLACEQGIYEIHNIQLLLKLIKSNSFYFDIGANIGLMAIPILRNCPDCKVVSWEPSPNTLAYLTRTAENSEFSDRWQIIGKAAGNEVGEVEFTIADAQLGALDGFRDTQRAGETRKVNVPVTTVDAEWEAMGCPPVSMIKVDIEGADLYALQGARNCIQKEKPAILLEWNATNLKAYSLPANSLLAFSKEIGYEVFSVPKLLPVTSPSVLSLQMFETETFLLISA